MKNSIENDRQSLITPGPGMIGFIGGGVFIVLSVISVYLFFLFSYPSGTSDQWGFPLTGRVSSTTTPLLVLPTETTITLPVISRTPFQPLTYTPTVTVTLSPTATASATSTPTLTVTLTPTQTIAAPTPSKTNTPEVVDSASIPGMTGYAQTLSLSCEARSAVDLASYFGIDIPELEFLYALPVSDNPNTGFVGSPNDYRGQIPPKSYGVHAVPVAALLRAYGLNANSYSGLTLDDLKREIASGDPAMVWVIGNVWNGKGVEYTASDGETLTVAVNEHTVLLIGYTEDTITVLDGNLRYSVAYDRFLISWAVLGNMAIIVE